MKRFRRYIFNTLTVISLLLLLATVGLWVRGSLTRSNDLIVIWYSPELYVISEKEHILRIAILELYQGNLPPGKYRVPMDKLLGFTYWNGTTAGRHGFTSLGIPHWFLTLIFAILPPIWLFKWRKRRRLARVGKCPSCGYDLTGNESGVCPECGKSIGTEAQA